MTKQTPFYVQLHMHTCESSRCGKANAVEMAHAAKEMGYGLIVITDHFFNANINCDRHLPWPDQVAALMKGYRIAQKEGEKIGLPVLFGWETNTGGPEILTYGLGEEYLLEHPDIAEWPLELYMQRMNEAGAFCVHAHPFREAYYIIPFEPQYQLFEAFEVFNYHHGEEHRVWDTKALRMARAHGLIELAGSDAHQTHEMAGGAVELPYPVQDMPSLIRALRSRKTKVIEHL